MSLGCITATFVFCAIKTWSPHKIILFSKIACALACIPMVYGNVYLMIACRYTMGLCLGLLVANAPSCLYQMAPPKYRQLMIGSLNLLSAPFNMLGFTLGIMDTGTRYFWRIHFVILFCIMSVDILIMIFFFMNKDSMEFTLKNQDR